MGIATSVNRALAAANPDAVRTHRWYGWAKRAWFAVADQGFISASNFLLGIALARWLSPSAYGAFAIGYAIFLLLTLFYQAVVLEPMSVYGGAEYSETLDQYCGSLLRIHAAIALLVVAALYLSVKVVRLANAPELSAILWALAIASPFVLLLWLTRRSAFLKLSAADAAFASCIYSVVLLAGIVVLHFLKLLTASSAFLLMAAGALIASAILLYRLHPKLSTLDAAMKPREVWRRHWAYGRWSFGTSLAQWAASNIYFLALGGAFGMAESGQLKALVNFALPAGQVFTALYWIFQPHASKVAYTEGPRRLNAFVRRVTVLYSILAVGYWIIILVLQKPVVHLLYAGKYDAVTPLLGWLAISSILQAAGSGVSIGLRAVQWPAGIFYATAASAVMPVLVGFPAMWRWGLPGVIAGLVASNAIALVLCWYLLAKRLDNSREVATCAS